LVNGIGKEILTFRDPEHCAEIVGLLANEARCPEIRQAARARSLRDHTYTV
jgi:hypothetical protein